MISVFGDESHSTAHATYGLLAVDERNLRDLDRIVAMARSTLGATATDPLHCRILFHKAARRRSGFSVGTLREVENTCAFVIGETARLQTTFYFGRVDRDKAPKILHVPLISDTDRNEVIDARLKLELQHLQYFAYGAAATRACHTLREPANRVIVDRNRSVIRWFNENRQAGRMPELFSMDATLPKWPAVEQADDNEHAGLQIADILTYYGTKQFFDPRFARGFDLIRPKTHFMVHEFSAQVCEPYVPPDGFTVRPLPPKQG